MLELTLLWLLFPTVALCDADALITSAIAAPRVRDVCFNSCDPVLMPGGAEMMSDVLTKSPPFSSTSLPSPAKHA